MRIREATREDVPAVARHIVMAEGEMVRFFTGFEEEDRAAKVLEGLVLSPTPCRYSLRYNLVAEIDGKPAGSIISFPADSQPRLDTVLLGSLRQRGYDLDRLFFEGERGSYYLSTMGVDSAYRGRGAGTALLAAAEREAGRQGYARVSLLVSRDKEKAKALYERLGYVVSEEVTIGDAYRYYRMGKQLSAQGSGLGSGSA